MIRFACRNCTTRLAAPLRAAGKKLRCPYCFTDLVVPKESAPANRDEGYGLSDPAAEPRGANAESAYVTVVCPVCATRMYTTSDQVGQTMTCPDCGSAVVVRATEPTAAPDLPRPVSTEEYAVLGGEGQASSENREVYQVYIPVVCPTCQTRMLATENEVGQELVCPDCETRVRVPPLAVKAPVQPYHRSAEERQDAYEVAGGCGAAVPAPAPTESEFLLVCDVCHTRLHVTPDQVGHEILCPDCYAPIVVPEAPAAKEDAVEAIDEYQVAASTPPPLEVLIPGFEPVVDDGPLRRKKDPFEERRERELARQGRLPPKPRRSRQAPTLGETFFSGVFNYPCYHNAWNKWVALSTGMFFVFAVANQSLALGGIRDPRTYFLSAMFLAIAGLSFLVWLVLAAADLLDVVRDTANGADEVEPNETLWLDRILECLFPVFAFGIAVLPAVGINAVLGQGGLTVSWVAPLSLFFLFPVVLLSMLANGTPLVPVSVSVFASLWIAGRAWALFYGITFLLGAAITGVGWLLFQVNIWLDALVLAVFQVWAMMVYARLLGRLAWYCSQGEE